MNPSHLRSLSLLIPLLLALWPVVAEPEGPAVRIIQDRLSRLGPFLVLEALVENTSPHRLDGVGVSVEFYTFFEELLTVGHTSLRPRTLGPGHVGTLRVLVPFNEATRKLGYRFTWWREGKQVQALLRRHLWDRSRTVAGW